MFVLFRLILVAALGLPQGLCCIATGCDRSSKRVVQKTEQAPVCCKCCKTKSETQPKDLGFSASKDCPGQKCECRCRFQVGLMSTPVSLDSSASSCGAIDRTVEVHFCVHTNEVTQVSVHPLIRLQILYCIWRC